LDKVGALREPLVWYPAYSAHNVMARAGKPG